MTTLFLPLKGEYFDQIKAGTKTEEYRLCTPYWRSRLENRECHNPEYGVCSRYRNVVLTRGYPRCDDDSRRLVLPWRGYQIKTITHPHFGDLPVQVYAIDVRKEPTQ